MNFNNETNLLLKHRDLISDWKKIVAIGLNDIGDIKELIHLKKDITFFLTDFSLWKEAATQFGKEKFQYGASFNSNERFDGIVMYLPKSKALIEYMFSMAATFSKSIILVGKNSEGVKSTGIIIEKTFGSIIKKEYGGHCTLFVAELNTISKPKKTPWDISEISVANEIMTLASLPGVFSRGKIDAGTAFLLENMTVPENSKILDFACGNGVIGIYIFKKNPSNKITFCDSSALAIDSAKKTADLNGISNAKFIPSDIFSEIAEKDFDLIISNPPFHEGHKVQINTAEQFITNCPNFLKQGGKLLLVANTFLKYEPLIKQRFGNVSQKAMTPSYKVLEATKN